MGGLNAVHLPQRLQICTSPGLRIDLSWSLLQLEGSSLATSLSVAAWLFWGLGEHLLDRRRTQNHRPGFLKPLRLWVLGSVAPPGILVLKARHTPVLYLQHLALWPPYPVPWGQDPCHTYWPWPWGTLSRVVQQGWRMPCSLTSSSEASKHSVLYLSWQNSVRGRDTEGRPGCAEGRGGLSSWLVLQEGASSCGILGHRPVCRPEDGRSRGELWSSDRKAER